jgi:superfamily II DNA/RNA helicase
MNTTFKALNLNPQICKALEACGYETPTPVQFRSIPEILKGKDLVASAQTGSGKTAAFVLPALEKLALSKPQKKPRILILTPTRELANQITQAIHKYGKFLKFYSVNLVGGMAYPQQIRSLTKGVDIVIATPGRLMDHMESKRISLSEVQMLILDEADRMLDMGFIEDVKHIAKSIPASRQTLLFSATLDKQIENVVKQLLNHPVRIDFSHETLAPKQIKQIVYFVDNPQHKTKLLEHILENQKIFKAIIFTATKRGADHLAEKLRADGLSASALHGDLKQSARNRAVEQMRRGKIQYLVATDVAARGIDISDITHVINYDVPRFPEDYVHRIGRTGRAGKTGLAISLALPTDIHHLFKIERYTEQKIERSSIGGLEPKKVFEREKPSRDKRVFRSKHAHQDHSQQKKHSEKGSWRGFQKKRRSSKIK